jgi:hypothetical protein
MYVPFDYEFPADNNDTLSEIGDLNTTTVITEARFHFILRSPLGRTINHHSRKQATLTRYTLISNFAILEYAYILCLDR